MKKLLLTLLSVLLAFSMLFSFTACSEDTDTELNAETDADAEAPADEEEAPADEEEAPADDELDIVGEWTAIVDMSAEVGIDSFDVDMTLEFTDDGEYTMAITEDAMRDSLAENLDAIIEAAGAGMSTEEFLEMSDMTEDDFIDSMMADFEEESTTGEYTFEDGTLTIDGEEVAYDWDGETLAFDMGGMDLEFTK